MLKKSRADRNKSKGGRKPGPREKEFASFLKAARAIGIHPTEKEYERALKRILFSRRPSPEPSDEIVLAARRSPDWIKVKKPKSAT
jgi:hypothetical protein